MKTRIISAVVLLPLLIFLVVSGGIWLKITIGILSLIGMYEFYQAFSKNNKILHIICYLFAIFYVIFIEQIYSNYLFNIFVSVFLVVILIYTVLFHQKTNIMEGMGGFFGFFYVCFLLSHIYLIRQCQDGQWLVWLAFISAFGCDTGAYFTGVACGKHKLIPALSPNKTVEGSIGGILTATILAILYGFLIQHFADVKTDSILLICGFTGFFGSILSQFGDLAASSMKRFTKIKDFGKLIPGHGGIIDRFDSVLLTAPALYYIIICLSQTNLGALLHF